MVLAGLGGKGLRHILNRFSGFLSWRKPAKPISKWNKFLLVNRLTASAYDRWAVHPSWRRVLCIWGHVDVPCNFFPERPSSVWSVVSFRKMCFAERYLFFLFYLSLLLVQPSCLQDKKLNSPSKIQWLWMAQNWTGTG